MGNTLNQSPELHTSDHCRSLQEMLDGSGMTLLADTIYLGTGKSHHGVEFGEVELEGEVIDVAIKNYNDPDSATREASAYETANDRGIETFDVFEVGCSETSSILMTRMVDELYAYDNLELPDKLPPSGATAVEKDAYDNVAEAFVNISNSLAYMHATGFYHGDAVLKNFGVDPTTYNTLAFDFESAIYTETPLSFGQFLNLLENEGNDNLQIVDLVHLWRFTVSPYETDEPFLSEESDEVILSEFNKLVLEPYISFLAGHAEILFGDDIPKSLITQFRQNTITHLVESMNLRVST